MDKTIKPNTFTIARLLSRFAVKIISSVIPEFPAQIVKFYRRGAGLCVFRAVKNRLLNIPRHLHSFWVAHEISRRNLDSLTIGRIIYVDHTNESMSPEKKELKTQNRVKTSAEAIAD